MISLILKTVQQTTFNNFHQLSPIIVYETEIKGFLPSLYKSFEDGSFDNSTGKITGELNGKVLIHQDTRLCLLYTSPSPRDDELSRMPSSA